MAPTEAAISGALDTAGQPDPDLLIRTSGEMRVSNFLLWQIAYSEIVVTPTLWPDFRLQHLLEAIVAFQGRERRFGGLEAPAAAPAANGSGDGAVPGELPDEPLVGEPPSATAQNSIKS